MYNLSESELHEIHEGLLELLKAFKVVCDQDNIWYSLAYGTVLGAVRHKGFIPWDTDADVAIRLSDVDRFRKAFYKYKPNGILLKNYEKDSNNTKSHDLLCFEKKRGFSDLHLDIYPMIGTPNDEKRRLKVWKRNYFLDRFFRSKYVNLKDCQKKNRLKVGIVKAVDTLIPDSYIKANIHRREIEFDVEESDYLTCLAAANSPVPKKVWDKMVLLPFEDTEFYVPGDWDLYLKTLYGDYMTPRKY